MCALGAERSLKSIHGGRGRLSEFMERAEKKGGGREGAKRQLHNWLGTSFSPLDSLSKSKEAVRRGTATTRSGGRGREDK